MHEAQNTVREVVLPWLATEQADAEAEYRQVTRRFIQIGNDFLKKLEKERKNEVKDTLDMLVK